MLSGDPLLICEVAQTLGQFLGDVVVEQSYMGYGPDPVSKALEKEKPVVGDVKQPGDLQVLNSEISEVNFVDDAGHA